MSPVLLHDIDWSALDWGIVPQWVAALGSLFAGAALWLAFQVFKRDRENADRVQVDRVAAWATAEYERRLPPEPRVEEGTVTFRVRNSNEVPVRVVQVGWRIDTVWWVVDTAQSRPGHPGPWTNTPGTQSVRMFSEPMRVPPGETTKWSQQVNVAHTAPDGADQLDVSRGVTAHVDWLLVLDNAGRRWVVRPETGGRAERVGRRWSRTDEYMPSEW